MECPDEDLARAASAGDADAFAALVERHYDRVFRLAFRLTGQREEAEDLTQDVCAALPAKISRFRGEARFTTWLWRVVVNAAHDRRRRGAAHQRAAAGWGEAEMLRRAEAAERADDTTWLTRAMARLPDMHRDTLALVLDGMTQTEAGEVLGVSEGTVAWRVSEAKRHLRELREAEA